MESVLEQNVEQACTSLCVTAANKFPDDIDDAVDWAYVRVQKLSDYEELCKLLVQRALRSIIADARHSANTKMRRAAGDFGKPAKIASAASPAVNTVAASCYSYFIAGKTLGKVMGKELLGIAETEQERADGCLFNVRLARALNKIVPPDKRVEEAVSEKKLTAIFRKCKHCENGQC
jgi:hypothetical protein